MSAETFHRNGDWALTYNGVKFYPLDPRPVDINIGDIAHALSLTCRYNGHCRKFYSVAQHSVLVHDILPEHLKFQGLMHDATEAYVGDMVRPLKYSLPQFRQVEDVVWFAIAERFGIDPQMHPDVKAADNRVLMTEKRDLLKPSKHPWGLEHVVPLPKRICPLPPEKAERLFLKAFHACTR